MLHVFQESAGPVTAGTPVLDVGDPADLEVVVELLSRDGAALAPGTRVELEQWGGPRPLEARVRLVEPLDYIPFVQMLSACDLVLTDSGGVQEEAPALSKPVLVLRDKTERPEGVEAGCARLVGTRAEAIVAEASRLLDDAGAYAAMTHGGSPYGDGRAAERIANVLEAEALGLPRTARTNRPMLTPIEGAAERLRP